MSGGLTRRLAAVDSVVPEEAISTRLVSPNATALLRSPPPGMPRSRLHVTRESAASASAIGREAPANVRLQSAAFVGFVPTFALIVYLGFHAGGYPPGSAALAAALLAVAFAARVAVAPLTVQRPGAA